jgi:HSP90 family molecular chaperone
VVRGTKIIVQLREDAQEFAQKQAIQNIIKTYSNFVGFPIKLNGETVNTVKPLWTMSKSQVTADDHKQFYQFISNSFDTPMYTLHYHTDSPINIRAVFYVPEQHLEKYGMGRMEPGVALYCRKVLIQAKAKGLMPDWLRFVKGVVDSEDIPLNLSREHLQDSALIQRVSNVITRKLLGYLSDEMRSDRVKYERFFREYAPFLKEGVLVDSKWKDDLAKLLLFESSATASDAFVSLAEYVDRMPAEQKDIYFLSTPSRRLCETSPYYETFKARKLEVLFVYQQVDEFVMNQIGEYSGKRLVSIETVPADALPKTEAAKQAEQTASADKLPAEELKELITWLRNDALSDKVYSVRETDRLSSTPAVIVGHESASYRRMMKFVDPSRAPNDPKHNLEINPSHPLIRALASARTTNAEVAKQVAQQMYDNALIAAGLMDDARPILTRMTTLLEAALKK